MRLIAWTVVCLLGLGPRLQGAEPPVDVTIAVEGIRTVTGQLKVGLFERAGFPFDEGKVLFGMSAAVAGTNQTVVIKAVPPGEYAVLVHHDENSNGRMDYGIFGRPREGYGVSNNRWHSFRAPSYEETKVTIKVGATMLRVKVGY